MRRIQPALLCLTYWCLVLGCGIEPASSTSATVNPQTGQTDAGGLDSAATGNQPTESDASAGTVGPELCESLALQAKPLTPDMLIVLDRSLSMTGSGRSGLPRWPASVSGVKSVTEQLDATIRFGLMVFPGNTKDFCAPGEMQVELELGRAPAIAQALDTTTPSGGTPTADSLRLAHEVLIRDRNIPDADQHSKFVLLVTDGAPTCKVDAANGITSGPDEQNTFAAVSELAADEIKTYVVGYDTRGSQHEASLNEMARRGNTGDTAHRAVEDEASLVAELGRIAASAVSCSYVLNSAPSDPRFVRVAIDGQSYAYEKAWQLSDETTISLLGPACDVLRDGKTHVLEITVECEPVMIF